jgi:hypothetical protein
MNAMFTLQDLKDHPTAFKKMKTIAEELMNNRVLIVGQNNYRRAEIEFYIYHESKFPDGSTHKHALQLTSNKWYFHRFPKSENLKPLNRIGIDLTCGNLQEVIYGGILIRSILNIGKNGEYIYGPAKTVKHLINDFEPIPGGPAVIEEIDVYGNGYIRLVTKELEHRDVYECPRYGLNPETAGEFYEEPYRFVTFGEKKHANKEKTIFPYLKTTDHAKDKILNEFNRKTI